MTKSWVDNSNQDGKRPASLTLTLNGVPSGVTVPTPTVTGTDTNSWTYTWSGLPEYNNGSLITYTVSEENVPQGYEVSGSPANNGGTITNTHTPETINVTVTKSWVDNSNQDGKRPTSLTLTLNGLPSGTTAPTPTVTGTDTNSWTYTWSGVPKYSSGSLITYTVSEENVPQGYEVSGSPANNGGTITNTHEPLKTTISAAKTWSDSNDNDGLRSSVGATVQLYKTVGSTKTAVGDAVNVPTTDGTFQTWTNLNQYENGTQIQYSVEETLPADCGYTADETEKNVDFGGTASFTNSHTPLTTTISASKTWSDNNDNDGLRSSVGATVQLYKTVGSTKTAVGDAVNVPTTDGSFKTWTNLNQYENGVQIQYSVEETLPANCGNTVDNGDQNVAFGGTASFTNSHELETKTITVTKNWVDNSQWIENSDNWDGIRPTEVEVTLTGSDGKTYTESFGGTGNTWTKDFTVTKYYDQGTEVTFTAAETKTNVITGRDWFGTYACSDPVSTSDGFTITNTHTPRVIITYVLNGGRYLGSPDDIVEIYEAGETITIHAAPHRLGYTFRYWKGSVHHPGDAYVAIADHTFVAQWTRNSNPWGPQTGDNTPWLPWLGAMLLSGFGLAGDAVIRRRKRKEEK